MGHVDFVPTAEPLLTPSREVGADGTFTLTTIKPGDGAPAGKSRVRIAPMPKDPALPPRARRPRIPFRDTDEDISVLVIEVTAWPNHLEPFRLK